MSAAPLWFLPFRKNASRRSPAARLRAAGAGQRVATRAFMPLCLAVACLVAANGSGSVARPIARSVAVPVITRGAAVTDLEKIIPTPQQVTYADTFLTLHDGAAFTAAIVKGRLAPQAEMDGVFLLRDVIGRLTGGRIAVVDDDADRSMYPVIISVGAAQNNSLNAGLMATGGIVAPDNPEGYAVDEVTSGSQQVIVVAGREAIGSYYGATSLAQMIKLTGAAAQARVVSIRDWPDMKIRAIKDIANSEGHFTYADDMEWMRFLPQLKINTFSLCYTHLTSTGWRNPPPDYLRAVRDLGNYERDHGTITFMPEVNPGYLGGLPTNAADEAKLVDLFKDSLDQGATRMLMAFDDQGSTTPTVHRDLANRLYDALNGPAGFTMTTVPQPYNLAYSNIASYLNAYTSGLNPAVSAAWTGDAVWSSTTTPAQANQWRGYTTNPPRYPFYWNNDIQLQATRGTWAPSDYTFTDQKVPFKGINLNGGYLWKNMDAYTADGVIENIFRELTTHKVYAISLADWLWNPDAYDNSSTEFQRAKRYWDTIVSNPGFRRPASASSQFSAAYPPNLANDGLSSHDLTENAWATASGLPTAGAWWSVDLGTRQDITGLAVKFRELVGKAYMVPRDITFQVSDDGATWNTMVARASDVPVEGSTYDSTAYRYHLGGTGRYVRLLFEDGGQNSLIELSEVDVLHETDPVPAAQRTISAGAVAAASSVLDAAHPANAADDGMVSGGGTDNAWSTAAGGSGQWWSADLGGRSDVHGVDVNFDQQSQKATMVPRSITFQVSDDNATWNTVLRKDTGVPVEGTVASTPDSYHFDVRGTGRYVRLLFEDGGQNTRIALSEVAVNTDDLALRRPATASSSQAGYGAGVAADGDTARTAANNAWATATGATGDSWWQVDLGSVLPVGTIRAHYREYPSGSAYVVPRSVTVEGSVDGSAWTTLSAGSADVPANGGRYTSQAYEYAVNGQARYVRLRFPDGGQDPSLLEVSEVEVTAAQAAEHQMRSRDLAYRHPATASSSFGPLYSASAAVDGLKSRENTEDAWVTANNQAVNSWWSVDLGTVTPVSDVQVYYREYPYHVAYMPPTTVTIQLSDDNSTWRTVVARSTDVPAAGASYSSDPFTYHVNASGRYLRLLFPDGGAGPLVELSEVRAYRAPPT